MQRTFSGTVDMPRKLVLDGWWLSLPVIPPAGDLSEAGLALYDDAVLRDRMVPPRRRWSEYV